MNMSTISRPASSLAPYRAAVLDAPVSYSVYSAFSYFGTRRDGELPGPWLVSALGALGHETGAIRQTLYRMERSRELLSRSVGRMKLYRLTPFARAEAEAGLEKIMQDPPAEWDGQWTLVQFQAGSEGRLERERFREIARVEGFASTGAGLLIHPRDRSARLLSAAAELGVRDVLEVFRCRRVHGEGDREFVARHWSLDDLADRYRAFVAKYRRDAVSRLARSADHAFLMRFAVVFEYLETAWADPDLPLALLPRSWPGPAARALARRLYRSFLPGAIRFAEAVMARVSPSIQESPDVS
jgi:phenylacetic acid degradation operon negative regulatory protein